MEVKKLMIVEIFISVISKLIRTEKSFGNSLIDVGQARLGEEQVRLGEGQMLLGGCFCLSVTRV